MNAGPDYRPADASDLGVPTAYANAAPVPAPAGVDLRTWWSSFGDPLLDQLVGTAISGNLDLATARTRLRQARETVVQARADGLPSVAASGEVAQSEDSDGRGQRTYNLRADASWEADLFGGNRRSVEASAASADATSFDLASARVSITAEVANNYLQLRLAQERLSLAEQTLAIADDNLKIARWRRQAGLVSSIDVEQAIGARAQIAATLPSYRQNASSSAYRLAVLTGQAPSALSGLLAGKGTVPSPPSTIAAGLPADTLRQRPDVRAAERTLAAETARIGVAQAQLYPSLSIGGSIGSTALTLGGLADLLTGNLFASLAQTIFDGGRTRSQVRSQQAAAEGAFASYKQTILVALEDVENGLVAVRTSQQRGTEFTVARDAARNQAILARSQYRAGLSDFQSLLEAERSLVSASDSLLVTNADRSLAIVQLFRALGGGWDPLQPAAA